MNAALVQLAISQAPALIALIRAAFTHAHPDEPEPTDAEIIAAYQSAFEASLAKDDRWQAAHPEHET